MRILLILFLFITQQSGVYSQSSHKEVLLLMGTRFELTALANNKSVAENAVQEGIEEIQRIENLISSWKIDSQTSQINKNAGIKPVVVNQELFKLIERSIKISTLTGGAFDISFASIDQLYIFDKTERSLPSKEKCKESVAKINFNNIILNQEKSSVYLNQKGMKIGFGGIGKGYAANKAKQVMKNISGVTGGVVNASGDLITWSDNNKSEGWPVQISDPKNIEESLGWLNIHNASIVTSGDYEKYFTNKGLRYAHIINPKTGLPTTGIKSVTIISPDAEIGDALATSVFVLGVEKGINLVNKLKNIESLVITDDDKMHMSNKLKLNKY
ncbi:FAD:protein FMN transferase [bacterium]|nr:FAD:protein FMN transferase [bacterium]